jgi:hypothetical protein
MAISIEAGCAKIPGTTNSYLYRYSDNAGNHVVVFLANKIPEIGDSIENGVLVPLVGYKINNDPGFQAKRCD